MSPQIKYSEILIEAINEINDYFDGIIGCSEFEFIDVYNILNENEKIQILNVNLLNINQVRKPFQFKKYPELILEKFKNDGFPRNEINSFKPVRYKERNNIEFVVEENCGVITTSFKFILVENIDETILKKFDLNYPIILSISCNIKKDKISEPKNFTIFEY